MPAPAPRTRASRWQSARARLAELLRGGEDPSAGVGAPEPNGGVDMPPAPPQVPPGWSTGPPDFVGVGFQRCGTTRWYNLIAAHPEVARPVAMKELHFFDRFHSGGFTEDDLAAYREYFPRPPGQKVGEWTPLYASAPWIPPLLARSAPEARLLMILRDPVERLISGLALDAAVAERRGMALSRHAPLGAFVRGLYHAELSHAHAPLRPLPAAGAPVRALRGRRPRPSCGARSPSSEWREDAPDQWPGGPPPPAGREAAARSRHAGGVRRGLQRGRACAWCATSRSSTSRCGPTSPTSRGAASLARGSPRALLAPVAAAAGRLLLAPGGHHRYRQVGVARAAASGGGRAPPASAAAASGPTRACARGVA